MGDRKHICIISHSAYTLLTETREQRIGGAQLQAVYIGNVLAREGYGVSYITGVFDDKREDEEINGRRILKTFAERDGIPGIHFFYPRIWRLWGALQRSGADIFYHRGSGYSAGVTALYCKLYGKKLILAGAHDRDFDVSNYIANRRTLPFFAYGVRHAHVILVQSEQQRKLLKDNFRREGVVVRNIFPSSNLTEEGEYALWVGRITEWKRPELFVDFARANPWYRFVMIGGREYREERLYEQVERKAAEVSNLDFRGFLPFHETEKYFSKASVLINTSLVEGFPNTYLQAWSRGIPTLACFDPDNVIRKNKLGQQLEGEADLRSALSAWYGIPKGERKRIQEYFQYNHSFESFVNNFTSQVLPAI